MKKFLSKMVSAVALVGAVIVCSGSARAADLDVTEPLEGGIATLNGNITTIAGAAIAICVVFLAIRYFRRA